MSTDAAALAGEAYESLIRGARSAAEDLLQRYFGLRLEKTLDLHTRGGFDAAVAALSAELRRETGAADTSALRLAMRVLDVDWRHTSAQQRRDLIAQAMVAAGRATARVPQRIRVLLGQQADRILETTRQDARRRHQLAISAEFNAVDRRAVAHVSSSQALFVTDEYRRRREDAGRRARRIVARGLEHGLGNDNIAADLHRELDAVLSGRSARYWDVVASAFTASARSYGQMSAYAEAGIERYRVSAVLDEATTDTCRFLDGKVLGVRAALDRFDELERLTDTNAIKSAAPWIREGVDQASGRRRLFVTRGPKRDLVADVARSGLGTRDDRGDFFGAVGEAQLAALGIGFPPYHGHCRTTTVPIT